MENHFFASCDSEQVKILKSLIKIKHYSTTIEIALEKLIENKNARFRDTELISTLAEYCESQRIRNPKILDYCSTYFEEFGLNLAPSSLKAFVTVFGTLNYQPKNEKEFWKVVKLALHSNLTYLRPEDILDIMLSCAYLEKYFLGFFDEIFCAHFLEKLYVDSSDIVKSQEKLKILDCAVAMECNSYKGPMLSVDSSITSFQSNIKVHRILENVIKQLRIIGQGKIRFSKDVYLSCFPKIHFYKIDLLVHPTLNEKSFFEITFDCKNVPAVVLVNLTENYCGSEILTGPFAMKQRQLQKLGFKVWNLNFEILNDLSEEYLNRYLTEMMKK